MSRLAPGRGSGGLELPPPPVWCDLDLGSRSGPRQLKGDLTPALPPRAGRSRLQRSRAACSRMRTQSSKPWGGWDGGQVSINSLSITNHTASPQVLARQKHYREERWRETPRSHDEAGEPRPNSPCPTLPSSHGPAPCRRLAMVSLQQSIPIHHPLAEAYTQVSRRV